MKKFKIRIILCSVALLGALVVLGISTGLFTFIFKGYDGFFNLDNYSKRQMFVNSDYEVLPNETEVALSTVSPYDKKELSGKLKVSVQKTADGYNVTLTFVNKYGLDGGGIFSGMFLEETGDTKYPAEKTGAMTKVCLVSGEDSVECALQSYTFKRGKSIFVFSGKADNYDKIVIEGFALTEFRKR